jgi:hypothetical protein
MWAFDKCPAENECENGHNTCDPETQDCEDKVNLYNCKCKEGYIPKLK